MESSRIFVRGLPPNLTSEEFTKHFSRQSPITDAKLIPQRRIGYVGYKNPEDATRAVKYHNKSFIRMSRIGVELARSVEEQSALRPAYNLANGGKRRYRDERTDSTNDAVPTAGKKQRVVADTDKDGEAKLQEFLEVMQPPSKSKTWKNQDTGLTDVGRGLKDMASEEMREEKTSDSEYEFVPGKQVIERATVREQDHVVQNAEQGSIKDNQDDLVRNKDDSEEPDDQKVVVEEKAPASDADWLRSRTSRLLGLVEDDDTLAASEVSKKQESSKDTVPPATRSVESPDKIDAGVQTDDEDVSAKSIPQAPTIDEYEGAPLDSARLFIRNLPYKTSEEELRRHFESGGYGTVEEVSINLIICLSTFWDATP